MPTNTVTVL
ncbi:hypothetical protein C354_04908 [Cryptococcus neoformans MW-RSA1955]|nr:hypothetical protein C354_04908 [Cryptococcus neoformans var. grubii MW-RSA1955]OXG56941.1 hypothetical protein C352_04887 [Cryptococcus neoformans var. grubii CHC193]